MSISLPVLEMLNSLNQRRSKGRYTESIAKDVGKDSRTIRRWVHDVNQLASAHLPNLPFSIPGLKLTTHDGRSWVELVPMSIGVSIFQYAAAFTAVSALKSLLGASADDVLDKLEPQRDVHELVQKAFHYRPFGPKQYHDSTHLDSIVQALLYSHPIKVLYKALESEEEKEHDLEPYTLVLYRDAFYLIGRLVESGRKTLLALDRFNNVEIIKDQTFKVPKDFNADDYFEGQFGIWRTRKHPKPIRLAFNKEAVTSAKERQWPGFRNWRKGRGDTEVLSLHVPVSPELISWILSWGPSVEVLGPESLRKEVTEHIEAMLDKYRHF